MFRNMVTSLLKYERIRTTNAKAKELRRWADHIITLAKRGDLHARRQVLSIVREKAVVHKLFEEADQRFGASAGGYTRVIKLGRRPGDAAPISMVELVISETKPKKKKTAKKTKKPEVAKKKVEAAEKKVEAAEAPAVEKAAEPKKEEQKSQKAKPEVKAKRTTKKKEAADKQETHPKAKAKPADKKTESKAETKSKSAPKKKPSTDKK
jgi:large subunit ribosomal protein L17